MRALVYGKECDLYLVNDSSPETDKKNMFMFEPVKGTPIGLQFYGNTNSSSFANSIIYRDIDSKTPLSIGFVAMDESGDGGKKIPHDVQVSSQPTPDINLINIVRDSTEYSPVVIKRNDGKYYRLVVQTSTGLYNIYVRNGKRFTPSDIGEVGGYSPFIGIDSEGSGRTIPICGLGKKTTGSSLPLVVVGKMPIFFFNPVELLDYYRDKDNSVNNNRVGIENPGGLCHLNASLQLLYNIPLIRYKIMRTRNGGQLCQALARQFAKMFFGATCTGKPAGPAFEVYNALFPNNLDDINSQADALGTLRALYAREMEEGNAYDADMMEFSFVLEFIRFVTLRAMEADNPNVPWKSVGVEFDVELGVPFGELEDLSLEERLDKPFEDKRHEGYPCDEHGNQNCTTSVCMAAPPPVLQVSLLRFVPNGKTLDKDCSHCSFQGTINLKKYFLQKNTSKATPEEIELAISRNLGRSENRLLAYGIRGACSQKSTTKYILYGVLVHSGPATGGHYTTYIRNDMLNPDNSKWLYFDDAKEVKTVSWDEMTKHSYGIPDDQVKKTYEKSLKGSVDYDNTARLAPKGSAGSCALALLYIQQDMIHMLFKLVGTRMKFY
jgi:hypothetical protein